MAAIVSAPDALELTDGRRYCAICGDPTHDTERHEATLDDDF